MKKWEYVKNSLEKLNAPERALDIVETIEEQLEISDLNKNAEGWKYEGDYMIVGDLIDLKCVLYGDTEYCYACEIYLPHCNFCPINSPSIEGCSKELMELLEIVSYLDDQKQKIN